MRVLWFSNKFFFFYFFEAFVFVWKQKKKGRRMTPRKMASSEDIRPSLIRQNKPPPLPNVQDLCFLLYSYNFSTETSSSLFTNLQGSDSPSCRCFRYNSALHSTPLEQSEHLHTTRVIFYFFSFFVGESTKNNGGTLFILFLLQNEINPGVSQ